MAMNDGWLFDPSGSSDDGRMQQRPRRDTDSGDSLTDYTPANSLPVLDQNTVNFYNQKYGTQFQTPKQLMDWKYGGAGQVVTGQDGQQYYTPASGDVNGVTNYMPGEPKEIASVGGLKGALQGGLWAPLAVIGGGLLAGGLGAGAGAAEAGGAGAAAGGAGDLGWAAGLTDAAGGSLAAPGAAGSAYAGLGGAAAGGGSLGALNGALTPGPGTLSALGGGSSGGGMATDPLAWSGADAGNAGAAGSLADTAGLGLAGGGGTLGSLGTLGTLSSLGQGALGALGSISAANTQANAAQNATNAQLGMFNTINQQQAPWRQAGQAALGDIASQQPFFQHQFNAQDLNANLAPNYQFMLDQGLTATKNAANLQSGLVSGNTLKGINDYAQNYAGNAYQQAFNNYSANQTNIFNRLSNIAGLGQTANASTANAGASISPGVANTMVGQGAAQAAGTIGATNAANSGIGNAMGWYSLGNLLNA